MEQGSQEWIEARLGKFTASAASEWVCANGEVTVAANTYILKKLGEIKTGESSDGFVNEDMMHGMEQEPKARAWYEKLLGNKVEEVGFIQHPLLPYIGASVDGRVKVLVEQDEEVRGTIEIKCPAARNVHIHLKHCTIDSPKAFKKLAKDYYWQAQTGMLCTGSAFCDFISFFPFLPDKSGFFHFRLPFDPIAGEIITNSAILCRAEMERLAEKLNIELPELFRPVIETKTKPASKRTRERLPDPDHDGSWDAHDCHVERCEFCEELDCQCP